MKGTYSRFPELGETVYQDGYHNVQPQSGHNDEEGEVKHCSQCHNIEQCLVRIIICC